VLMDGQPVAVATVSKSGIDLPVAQGAHTYTIGKGVGEGVGAGSSSSERQGSTSAQQTQSSGFFATLVRAIVSLFSGK
jgi:hypothetical protein